MNSEAVTTNLVKRIAVKVEQDESVELDLVKNEENTDCHIKYEREVPEDNSTDSLGYDIIIKTEESCDNVYGGRVTSDGEEFQLNDTIRVRPAVNGRVNQNMVGVVSSFRQQPFSGRNGYRDVRDGDAEAGKRARYLSVQALQLQSDVQTNGNFCECDVCGSFFCEERSNKARGSANLCPSCQRSVESSSTVSQTHNVSSTSTTSPTGRHPCDQVWHGLYNFHVKVCLSSSTKNAYLYSPQLNKLYTVINTFIPIQFECEWGEPDLYVRALPVFLGEVTHPVVRCGYHMRPSEEMNVGFPHVNHVIQCNHELSSYEQDESTGRLSVVAPLGCPPPGCNVVTILYKFMCKTSCLGGMDRNPIQVIFTLERRGMEVVGRGAVHVRICSCPFRDMKKEEHKPMTASEEYKRKKTKNGQAAPDSCMLCKKPKLDEQQHATYVVYNSLVGRHAKAQLTMQNRTPGHASQGGNPWIPVYGDKSVVKKAALLLRTSLIGEKLAAGTELTADDHKNWKILNQIIADGTAPAVTQDGSQETDS